MRKYKSCQALQSGIILLNKNLAPFFLQTFLKVYKTFLLRRKNVRRLTWSLIIFAYICLSANCTFYTTYIYAVCMWDQRYNHLYFVFIFVALLFIHIYVVVYTLRRNIYALIYRGKNHIIYSTTEQATFFYIPCSLQSRTPQKYLVVIHVLWW